MATRSRLRSARRERFNVVHPFEIIKICIFFGEITSEQIVSHYERSDNTNGVLYSKELPSYRLIAYFSGKGRHKEENFVILKYRTYIPFKDTKRMKGSYLS